MSLQDVTICVTSFLRPGYLAECLKGIRANLPECQVLVVDDSGTVDFVTIGDGTQWLHLPFDSGLPAKRNAGVSATRTKYWLCGCDDFLFDAEARAGIEKMVSVLDNNPDVDVASGRVHNQPYEGYLTYVPGEYVKETRLVESAAHASDVKMLFYEVDLTVNYFVARAEKIVAWDNRMKIGGEHFDWFWQMKQVGAKVVWVPGVNIETLHVENGADPRYGSYRARAVGLGHRIMMETYNIKRYVGFGEEL